MNIVCKEVKETQSTSNVFFEILRCFVSKVQMKIAEQSMTFICVFVFVLLQC